MRKPLIAGNWKMHTTPAEAGELASALVANLKGYDAADVLLFPPALCVAAVVEATKGSSIAVGVQNVHWEKQGAFTGENSVPMAKAAGCSHILVGHSERRHVFGETIPDTRKKVEMTFAQGLTTVLCVGETLEEREAGKTLEVCEQQVRGALEGIAENVFDLMVLAYEPVWAIGTGKTASPEQAEEVHAFLRTLIKDNLGAAVSEKLRILYGGSVKPENTAELMACENIDGALVGGASLKADSFTSIVKFQ